MYFCRVVTCREWLKELNWLTRATGAANRQVDGESERREPLRGRTDGLRTWRRNSQGGEADEACSRRAMRGQETPGGAEPMVCGPGAETPLVGSCLLPGVGVVCSRSLVV